MVTERASVVRIVTRLNIGGPARHVCLLTDRLTDRYPTTLVAGTAPPDEGELLTAEIDVVRVPLVRPPAPRQDLTALGAIQRIIATERPAIVHTHMAKAGMIGRLAARLQRYRARTVHTFHGHVLEGYFSPAVQASIVRVERLLARYTDALVAVSPEIRDELLDLGIGRPEQWSVIPLGLDLTAHWQHEGRTGALRRQLGLGPHVPLVGAVGRLVPIKDLATALRAVALVPDAHLAVVGDGELRGQLEALAQALNIDGRVHFTGWAYDMPAVFGDLDLALLSSRNEGTPVALIEAAACGRAVVATDVGGVRSVVEDGRTGLLVAPGDATEMAAAIAMLLGDPARAAEMGDAAREASARFAAERLVDDVANLYDGILS